MFLPVVKPIVVTALRIASVVLFILTLFAAFGGRFSPHYFSVPAVAVMIFPYLAIITAVVTLMWFFSGRWITGSLGVATLILAWAPLSAAIPLKFSRNPKAGADTFTLLSWNFLHGRDQNVDSLKQVGNKSFDFILDSKADIVCLQELAWYPDEVINMTPEFQARVDKAYPYRAFQPKHDNWVFSKYPISNIPVMDMLKRRIPGAELEGFSDITHYSFYKVAMPGHDLLLVNVHLISPGLTNHERDVVRDIKSMNSAKASASEMKNTILGKIKRSLINHDKEITLLCRALEGYEGPLIVCGDFNDVPESWGWRIMTKNGFHDAYQETGFGPLVTYNRHAFWLHLDQIFYRGPLRALDVSKSRIRTSDHYPLKATFQFDN